MAVAATPFAGRGRFITLEGGEGAGKSTQARILAEALAKRGLPVLLTREPGGAPGAEAIRGVLLGSGPWDGVAECMLHFAARREHVARSVEPALAAGMWVVCDRFADSTFAYQCGGQGVPRSVFDALAAVALASLRPDLTVLLDLPPSAGLARAAARGDTNRYEALDPAFHARVRDAFRAAAEAEPERWTIAEAGSEPAAVAAAVMAAVQTRLAPP